MCALSRCFVLSHPRSDSTTQPKFEYVLSVRLTTLQTNLYKAYLKSAGYDPEASGEADASDGGGDDSSSAPQKNWLAKSAVAKSQHPTEANKKKLFQIYHQLSKVWTHPGVLCMEKGEVQERQIKEYNSIDDFVVESSDEGWSADSDAGFGDMHLSKKRRGKEKRKGHGEANKRKRHEGSARESDEEGNVLKREWWQDHMDSLENAEDTAHSGKMVVLMALLDAAAKSREKLLLFSQSLVVLELIERCLDATGKWRLGRDYFRLDGSTKASTRQGWVNRFNDPNHPRARLFLISTKAGGLGVNLVAATRVVIFDAAWNPSQDTQAVFRAYRFGQTRPVYVYRLLAEGTMEQKIYWRQVAKNALSNRLLDDSTNREQFNSDDISDLFKLGNSAITRASGGSAGDGIGAGDASTDGDGGAGDGTGGKSAAASADRVLAMLLKRHSDLISGYQDHDSLADGGDDEGHLDEQSKQAAWDSYQEQLNSKTSTNEPVAPVAAVAMNATAMAKDTMAVNSALFGAGISNGSIESAIPRPLAYPISGAQHPWQEQHSELYGAPLVAAGPAFEIGSALPLALQQQTCEVLGQDRTAHAIGHAEALQNQALDRASAASSGAEVTVAPAAALKNRKGGGGGWDPFQQHPPATAAAEVAEPVVDGETESSSEFSSSLSPVALKSKLSKPVAAKARKRNKAKPTLSKGQTTLSFPLAAAKAKGPATREGPGGPPVIVIDG